MKPRIVDMTPDLQLKYAAFAARMAEAGIPFALNSVLRTEAEQAAYYAQGREPLEAVNTLRKAANMYLLKTDAENFIVTWTQKSRHFPGANHKSRAFDIVILKNGEKPTYDKKWDGNQEGISDYREAALIGQSVGLSAGGLWKDKQDWPHFELRGV